MDHNRRDERDRLYNGGQPRASSRAGPSQRHPQLMRRAYSLLLYLGVPLIFLRLVCLGFRNRGYWDRWYQRWGFAPRLAGRGEHLWVHAVSVGEVRAAQPIVLALRERFPELGIVLTTTTPSGARCVQLAERVVHAYLPYDFPGAVQRFLRRVNPIAAVVMETELWPNVLHQCRRFEVPVILANARLSERSVRGYRRVPGLAKEMLQSIAVVAAQSREDADRFISLGTEPARIRVAGSSKFDVSLPPDIRERARSLRRDLGGDRSIWMAASTHPGEERPVLEAAARLGESPGRPLLLLAPRHPERCAEVYALCRELGLRTLRRSHSQSAGLDTQVFLIDTLGELPLFYGAADVAFVGGSLVERGGHNPLEPASLAVPIITGPHVFNFKETFRLLTEAGAVRVVRGAEDLAQAVGLFLMDRRLREAAGQRGLEVVEGNRGAVERLMDLLLPYLDTRVPRGNLGEA